MISSIARQPSKPQACRSRRCRRRTWNWCPGAADAFNRRDLDASLALADEDVEAIPRVGGMEGGYHGHDGTRRWWTDLLGAFPDFSVEFHEVHDMGKT